MSDPRLGRRVQFDERSRAFGIREILPTTIIKPRSYSWSCLPHLNQLNTSSCVGHSIAHEAAARPVVIPNITHEIAMKVYRRALQLDPWPGEEDQGTSILAGIKAAMELGWYREYRWAFGLNDALLAIGHKGPGIAGLKWFTGMMKTDSSGFIHPTGVVEGQHAICVRCSNVKKEYVTLRQSWEEDWGQGGDCKLSFDDFGQLLMDEGEFCIPIKRLK